MTTIIEKQSSVRGIPLEVQPFYGHKKLWRFIRGHDEDLKNYPTLAKILRLIAIISIPITIPATFIMNLLHSEDYVPEIAEGYYDLRDHCIEQFKKAFYFEKKQSEELQLISRNNFFIFSNFVANQFYKKDLQNSAELRYFYDEVLREVETSYPYKEWMGPRAQAQFSSQLKDFFYIKALHWIVDRGINRFSHTLENDIHTYAAELTRRPFTRSLEQAKTDIKKFLF